MCFICHLLADTLPSYSSCRRADERFRDRNSLRDRPYSDAQDTYDRPRHANDRPASNRHEQAYRRHPVRNRSDHNDRCYIQPCLNPSLCLPRHYILDQDLQDLSRSGNCLAKAVWAQGRTAVYWILYNYLPLTCVRYCEIGKGRRGDGGFGREGGARSLCCT